ncbi:MAG TPA: aspartate aminotransferase family protein [Candidatus Acidoferrales bacterium]|nr:aspartate aminotransferase family protein [Candidatus Acidoferrales bacterium]
MTQALFPRSFRKDYPQAVSGKGCYIITSDGRHILDAAGSAAVVSIGHGRAEVANAMAAQACQIAFTHTSQFQTEIAERLAQRIRAMAPPSFRGAGRVFFTSGGSEATETALKLARQYHLERGQQQRVRMLARRQSYHGSTLGAMAVSANVARRAPFTPLLAHWGHIAPCFCYHCPFGKTFPECKLACADELELLIQHAGAQNVAAFLLEPLSGATLGAAVPPEGYFQRIAEICRKHGVLLIADEVMTGMGRTGVPFAVDHWGIEPDIILVGKGIASGYAPLGAVIVAPHVAEAIAAGSGAFPHGFTYQAHPVSMAAAHAVLDILEREKLFECVTSAGQFLRHALEPLAASAVVGDIRGRGLLLGIEFVRDRKTRAPFPATQGVAERVRKIALEHNVAVYPIQGCIDGAAGDHVLLAPPFTLGESEAEEIARALEAAAAQLLSDR